MRKIILSTVTMALITASASQAFAAQPQHHVRKPSSAASEQFRNARNAIQQQQTQPAWQYSGWSAPAGR
jgi:ABC-type transporter MlaC component